jgi:hypothetical protein
MKRMPLLCLLVLTLGFSKSQGQLPPVEVRNVRRVFHNGEHNAFTDLVRWNGRYWLTFRSCPDGHMVFPTSRVMILSSTDTKTWKQVHEFSVPRRDVRDPHFLVFKNQLFVYTGTWFSGDGELPRAQYDMNKHLGYGVKTSDGSSWSEPIPLEGTYGHYIWRAAKQDGKAWLCGRRRLAFSEDKAAAIESALLQSDDGLVWRFHSRFQETRGNETAFLFQKNGDLLAVSRTSGAGPKEAQLIRSSAPYQKWSRQYLGAFVGGPLVARWGNRQLVGGRRFTKDGPHTYLYWLHDEKLHEFAKLPSGGDNSYPGFVELDDGTGLISWYSSHEKDATGKTITAIYIADLKLK